MLAQEYKTVHLHSSLPLSVSMQLSICAALTSEPVAQLQVDAAITGFELRDMVNAHLPSDKAVHTLTVGVATICNEQTLAELGLKDGDIIFSTLKAAQPLPG